MRIFNFAGLRLAWLWWLVVVAWPGGVWADAARVERLFREPPREYSTGPLWVWNDLLTQEQVRQTLRDLAAQHVRQVWVHPRPGLMTPYLSPQWFGLWRTALQEAERLDMNVWIYDENSYPSGFAGGFVPELMPEARGRGLVLREAAAPPQWSDEIVGVYRLGAAGEAEDVTARVRAGELGGAGKFMVATEVRSRNSPWHGNRCYVNLLTPGVTEKFIEVTLEAYRREIGREFGGRVPGVFTDEPNIRPAGGWPWSAELAREFQRRWHYDLVAQLPSLSAPVGDWRKVRHNYFQVLNEQFIERWARPNHDFCEANQLEWTGHYWDHEWPNCMGVPDNMAMYPWHQRPSIDCLMNQYAEHTHAQFGNVRMVKELSSIANQFGRKRTLCEIYGAAGWDLRFEDMKRIGDWLQVLGVNTLNQHLSYVTLRGARKRDHPLSFSYHAPWWEAYHLSADYFARLSVVLSQGEQLNPVLVLQPTTTAWMYQNDKGRLAALGDSFFKLLMELEAAQVEYDIGSEDVLARHGSVGSSGRAEVALEGRVTTTSRPQLRIGERGYSTIVIPPHMENLNETTVRLLDQFLQTASGEVICLGEAPSYMDGAAREHLRALTNHARWRQAAAGEVVPALAPKTSGVGGLAIRRTPGDKGILFHHRRHVQDGQFLFLANTSSEAGSSGTLESGLRGVQKWDLYTGGVESYPHETQTGGGLLTSFELPPSGSLLLFFSAKSTPAAAAPGPVRVETLNPMAAAPRVRRLQPNVLTLDYVDVTAGGETRTNVYFYEGNHFTWRKNGLNRNPWDSAVQFRDELITRTFGPESGFEASYRFVLEGTVPGDLAIVIERPDLYTITCNDVPVAARAGDWWLDKAFGRIEISSAARLGENVVAIKARPFTMFHELEPAYLLGSFGVKAAGNGFVITAEPGLQLTAAGWNAQAHPFYSAGVAYEEQFDCAAGGRTYAVALRQWHGSVARVRVNGAEAGFIDAPPWKRDVTQFVRNGVNRVEVTVYGTLKNLLGPHHGNPPLGTAWPRGFQQGPNPGPPPGTNYSTVAYGLFEPFVLEVK